MAHVAAVESVFYAVTSVHLSSVTIHTTQLQTPNGIFTRNVKNDSVTKYDDYNHDRVYQQPRKKNNHNHICFATRNNNNSH